MRAAVMAAAFVILGSGCSTKSSPFPDQPGGGKTLGGGTGSDESPDAAVPDAPAGAAFRVCLVSDLRAGIACATTGAGGLTVTLGTATATTGDDGSFALTPPTGTGLMWSVTGSSIVTSVQQYGTFNTIPAITTTDFQTLTDDLDATIASGEGSLVIAVTHLGTAETGVEATTVPATMPFYDMDDPPLWSSATAGTSDRSSVLLLGVPIGTVDVTLTPTMTTVTPLPAPAIPVVDQAITFVDLEMPDP